MSYLPRVERPYTDFFPNLDVDSEVACSFTSDADQHRPHEPDTSRRSSAVKATKPSSEINKNTSKDTTTNSKKVNDEIPVPHPKYAQFNVAGLIGGSNVGPRFLPLRHTLDTPKPAVRNQKVLDANMGYCSPDKSWESEAHVRPDASMDVYKPFMTMLPQDPLNLERQITDMTRVEYDLDEADLRVLGFLSMRFGVLMEPEVFEVIMSMLDLAAALICLKMFPAQRQAALQNTNSPATATNFRSHVPADSENVDSSSDNASSAPYNNSNAPDNGSATSDEVSNASDHTSDMSTPTVDSGLDSRSDSRSDSGSDSRSDSGSDSRSDPKSDSPAMRHDNRRAAGSEATVASNHKTKNAASHFLALEENRKCAVCNWAECTDSNTIVFCDGCDVAVHQDCYGVHSIPEGRWLCRRCESEGIGAEVDCVLCPRKYGAFKKTTENKWIHLVCALWTPIVRVPEDSSLLEPIMDAEFVDRERYNLTCYVCRQRQGVCIQCAARDCFQAFHPTCAQAAGFFMTNFNHDIGDILHHQDYLPVYCHRHSVAHAPRGFPPPNLEGARKLLAEERAKQNAPGVSLFQVRHHKYWRTPNGTLILPQAVVSAVMGSMKTRLGIELDRKVVEFLCRYWTIKKDALDGVMFGRRLHQALEIAQHCVIRAEQSEEPFKTPLELIEIVDELLAVLKPQLEETPKDSTGKQKTAKATSKATPKAAPKAASKATPKATPKAIPKTTVIKPKPKQGAPKKMPKSRRAEAASRPPRKSRKMV